MPDSFIYQGRCHCGAVRARLEASKPADDLEVRACQCSFCSRQGGMTISDPAGRATFEMRRRDLTPYQFATRSGTTLVCAKCGTYAGAVLEQDGNTWSVINVRGLAIPEFKGRIAEPVVYDGETAEQRIERRKQRWTPTELRFIG